MLGFKTTLIFWKKYGKVARSDSLVVFLLLFRWRSIGLPFKPSMTLEVDDLYPAQEWDGLESCQ